MEQLLFTEQELVFIQQNIDDYIDAHSDIFYTDEQVKLLEKYKQHTEQ